MSNDQVFDVLGNTLHIGDKCAALTEGKEQFGSGHLVVCYVIGFSPKMVRLSLTRDGTGHCFSRKSSKLAKAYNQS